MVSFGNAVLLSSYTLWMRTCWRWCWLGLYFCSLYLISCLIIYHDIHIYFWYTKIHCTYAISVDISTQNLWLQIKSYAELAFWDEKDVGYKYSVVAFCSSVVYLVPLESWKKSLLCLLHCVIHAHNNDWSLQPLSENLKLSYKTPYKNTTQAQNRKNRIAGLRSSVLTFAAKTAVQRVQKEAAIALALVWIIR